jgi:hypothetical protein
MDVVVPSAIVENDFYCLRYMRTARPSESDLGRAYGAALVLANRDLRLARCTHEELRGAGAPKSFIDYLDSNVWGTHITPEHVDELVARIRQERQRELNALVVGDSKENYQSLDLTLDTPVAVS